MFFKLQKLLERFFNGFLKAFKGIVNGDYDDIPEQAFYMTGNIDEVVEKAKTEAA